MKSFGIEKPCSANWNEMTPNELGAFCKLCAKNVVDFTGRNDNEIKQLLLSSEKELCGRITPRQEERINNEFERWRLTQKKNVERAFLFSLLVVFGLSLFSCKDQTAKKELQHFQKAAKEWVIQTETPVETAETVAAVTPPPPPIPVEIFRSVEYAYAEQTEESPRINDTEYERLDGGYAGGMYWRSEEFEVFLQDTIVPDEYDEFGQLLPKEFASLAFPNPAQTNTTFELKVAAEGQFLVVLMDMNGKQLSVLHDGLLQRGTFRSDVDLIDLPSGMYLISTVSSVYKNVVKVVKM